MVVKRGFYGEEKTEKPQSQATHQQRTQRRNHTKWLCNDKLWSEAYSAHFETLIRKVVREEVGHVIQQSFHSISRLLPCQAKPRESRKFKLHFEGNLPHKLFTGNKVEAEGFSPIKLFLFDAITGHRVTDGPLSSIKVKIVVLHGHFKAEELENWTQHEFADNIVFERDGKRPLLVGQHVVLALHNGIGSIGDVSFTDNSSWERSKMFRLGAKVEAKEELVMEAVSNPFEVKDRRGENYQKHKIPSLEDEVWRLYWIAKDGKICERLAKQGIYNVKDFLTLYYLDESKLFQIVNVSRKKWEKIIQQATSCWSSNNTIPSLNVSTPIDIPMSNTICPCTIPSLNLQRYCMPPARNGDHDIQMSPYHTEECSYQLDQSATLDNPLVECYHSGSSSDDNLSPDINDSLLPYFPSMFDFETSSWFPVGQPMEEGNTFMGSSCNSETGMLSSIPNASVNASESANPKEDQDEVRALWKISVKHHGEAARKKGKFLCYSQ